MKWLAKIHLGKTMWSLVGLMSLALIEGQAAGQCVPVKLLVSDGAVEDRFGVSISISDDIANTGAAFGDSLDTFSRLIIRRTHHVPMR